MKVETVSAGLLVVVVFVLATPSESCCFGRGEVCPSISSASNRQHSCDDECNGIGTECTFSCSAEYQLIGSETTTCQNGCYWSSEFPVCQAMCPIIPSSSHRYCDCSDGRNGGSVCTFGCVAGYRLEGSSSTSCGNNGVWTLTQFPTCKEIPRCPVIPPCTYRSRACTNDRYAGSRCSFSCQSGYRLVGSPSVRCGSGGTWEQAFPTCEVITCEPPISSCPNGKVTCSDDNMLNSQCSFACDPNFELRGDDSCTCSGTGWSAVSPPRCVSISIGKK